MKPLSEAVSSRAVVSPKIEKSKKRQPLPAQWKRAHGPCSVEYHMPAPWISTLWVVTPPTSCSEPVISNVPGGIHTLLPMLAAPFTHDCSVRPSS